MSISLGTAKETFNLEGIFKGPSKFKAGYSGSHLHMNVEKLSNNNFVI